MALAPVVDSTEQSAGERGPNQGNREKSEQNEGKTWNRETDAARTDRTSLYQINRK